METNKAALVIFTKVPRKGQVKTRLSPHLSADWVVGLYKAMLNDVLAMAKTVSCDGRYIFHRGGGFDKFFLTKYRKNFVLRRQAGRNLGQSMLHAFRYCRRSGYSRTIVIGADCPLLNRRNVTQAFKKLLEYDIVLGPARDGGYYLIGLRQPDPGIFADIAWGTNQVLAETQKRARLLAQRVFLLKKKQDIDTFADFQGFAKSPGLREMKTETAKFVRRMMTDKGCAAGLRIRSQ